MNKEIVAKFFSAAGEMFIEVKELIQKQEKDKTTLTTAVQLKILDLIEEVKNSGRGYSVSVSHHSVSINVNEKMPDYSKSGN